MKNIVKGLVRFSFPQLVSIAAILALLLVVAVVYSDPQALSPMSWVVG